MTTNASTTQTPSWSPGSLVHARGRDWIVLPGSKGQVIRVRPISGSEDDETLIHVGLEREPVKEARFPHPDPRQKASHDTALLLRDALLLSLRRGAGPFRGFGQISFEPRAYQLVPLLMALKLDPVRLLVADDVGLGKTIEAALIARELHDRGDIHRLAVLCPPHLVDQWVTELDQRFNLLAEAVTSGSAKRLEHDVPQGHSIFTQYPYTVVSLDYIKSDRRREEFLRACPSFIIVDEAHTCAGVGRGRHQRYELLRGLADNPKRHIVLLTATPHSGNEKAFYRLLGLLDRDFERLADIEDKKEHDALRQRLAQHFVQRRRPDIDEWKEGEIFPRRETTELSYKLGGDWGRFFDDVLEYCARVVRSAEGDTRRERLNFWGTLALMRCVASSPAAAKQALRTRAGIDDSVEGDGAEEENLRQQLFDGDADTLVGDDVEPAAGNDDPELQDLIEQAEKLAGRKGDPKLKLVTKHLEQLLEEDFNPVVFCRYIATAHYLGEHLTRHFSRRLKTLRIDVVTGELPPEEREERVAAMGAHEKRLLVATDCLSEGINIQECFDSVVHYDLSWNPTRHEQREGRVDRFGQEKKTVRATLLYGKDNPVDGAVLEVILRKAKKIREELGVLVPMPDENHSLTQALMRAVFLRHRPEERNQLPLDFAASGDESEAIDAEWQDAVEKAVKSRRTVFAQRRLKPDEVLPEWRKTVTAIGGNDEVRRFTDRALQRLGSGLEPRHSNGHGGNGNHGNGNHGNGQNGNGQRGARGLKVPLTALPEDVRERLEFEGLSETIHVDFKYPPAPGCYSIHRSHPLVSVLAETLLERTLGHVLNGNGNGSNGFHDPGVLGRAGIWVSDAVEHRTTVALLRLRHQLTIVRSATGRSSTLLVEEAAALAWVGVQDPKILTGSEAEKILTLPPVADVRGNVRERVLKKAVGQLNEWHQDLDAFANNRADELLADHRRVREAAQARGQYKVKAHLPTDVIALFVVMPKID